MILIKDNKQPLTMAIDWLQWSGYLVGDGNNSLPDLECPDTYRLEVLNGNNTFKYRAILYNCLGLKMLTILWCPKSPILQYNIVVFQVANPWLYKVEDYSLITNLASKCFIYQFATMTRLDIAVDFELKRKQKNIVKGLYHQTIYCAGKQRGSLFWSKPNGVQYPHDFNFGAPQSQCKWKLYNKSLELHVGEDNEDKPYIIERWCELGMDKSNVWRLEVSITDFNSLFFSDKPMWDKKGKMKFTNKQITLEDITDLNIMCIYSHLYYKRFQLKIKKHYRPSNDKSVYLFELEKHVCIQSFKPDPKDNHIDNSIMYHLINVIESDACKRNWQLLDSSCDALLYYVKFNGLDGLFSKVKGMELYEYINKYKDSFGDGIKDMIKRDDS